MTTRELVNKIAWEEHITCRQVKMWITKTIKSEEGKYYNIRKKPKTYDVYLVKTKQGCYDFAIYDIYGWHHGQNTDGHVEYWRNIPLMKEEKWKKTAQRANTKKKN